MSKPGAGATIEFYDGPDATGNLIDTFTPTGYGDNTYEEFQPETSGVVSIKVTFDDDSGSIPSVLVTTDETASLGDYVWCDANSNGVQDDGEEQGLNGITVNLLQKQNDDSFSQIDSTVTANGGFIGNSPGFYAFTELDPGTYKVQFVDSTGAGFTTKNADPDTSSDSDADAGGFSDEIVLNPGDANVTIDAGILCNTVPVTIGYFQSAASGDTVDFTWQTATETSNAGFNLYGATDDGLVKLNESLIQSTVIDSVEPTDYAYSAVTSATSFYIEDVSIDGKTDQAGPFALGEEYGVYISTAVELEPVMYLPLIQH